MKDTFEAENAAFMSVLIVLIIVSITVALGFLIAFIWSVKTGQYEDDYTPSIRMLFDNVTPKDRSLTNESKNQNQSKNK